MEKLIVWKKSNHSSSVGAWFYSLSVSLPHRFWAMLAHVYQAAVTGLIVNLASFSGSFKFNYRKYLGFGFMLMGGLTMAAHLFFDPMENFPYDPSDYYYMNPHFFMHSIRMYIAIPFFTAAVFYLQPTLVSRRLKLITMLLVMGYCVPTLVMLPFAKSNFQYNIIPLISLGILATGIIITYITNFNWFQYIKYHKIDGNTARMDGLCNTDSIPDNLFRQSVKQVWKERKKLTQTY